VNILWARAFAQSDGEIEIDRFPDRSRAAHRTRPANVCGARSGHHLDRTLNTDGYASYGGDDNVVIGKFAGTAVVKLLPNGGNVELRRLTSNQAQVDREKGFRDGIAVNPRP